MAKTLHPGFLPRSRSRNRSPIAACAIVFAGVLGLGGAATTAAAIDVVVAPIASGTTDEIAYTIEHHLGEPALPLGTTSGQSYLVRVENLTSGDVRVGLSVDVSEQGAIEDMWTSDFLTGAGGNPGEPVDPQGLIDTFSPTIGVGGTFEMLVPDWPGMTYVFQQLEPTPLELARVTSDGMYVPFPDLALPDGGISVATLSGPELFSGMTATVTASGLMPGEQYGVWMAPNLDYFSFMFTGAILEPQAFEAGRATVGADGSYSATVSIPSGTPLGQYQLIVGDPTTRSWPAGSFQPFQVVAPAASATETTVQGTSVTNSFPIGGSTVSLGFGSVLEGGETTVTASRTGPLPTGFQFAATPPTYFHIDTTASFSGQVQVCMTYDSQSITTPPRLYHFEDGAWSDITTIREAGRVCGMTDSFSPFVLGLPNGVELANKHQCKDGGWRTSTLPPFANQGACVSWFQARGW